MSQNRYYSSAATPTTLAAAITSSSSTSISVNSVTGNPTSYPFTMLIDWGLPTQEAVSVTASSGSGPYTLTVTRGLDGTTAQTHVNGATIVHGVTAEDYNEPQVHISTGTSSGSYPGVIHGLQASSSVVGTTDTQTLTNKTLGATTFSGAITASMSAAGGAILNVTNTHSSPSVANVVLTGAANADLMVGVLVSGDSNNRFQVNSAGKLQWGAGGASAVDTDLYRASASTLETDGALTVGTTLTSALEVLTTGSATGEILQVTNTTGAPTNPNVIIWANSATDANFSSRVTGDTHSRFHVLGNGQVTWGPGGSTATDTNLYRNAAGELKSDNSLTVATNGTFGGAQLLAGGSGVVGYNNAGTNPTTTPSGGAVQYAKSGYMKYRAADGLDYNTGANIPYLTSPFTSTTSGSFVTVTGLTAAIAAGTYQFEAMILFSQAATVGTAQFAVNGPTSTTLGYTVQQYIASTATISNQTAYNTGVATGTLTANTTYSARILGLVVASASGTLAVTYQASAAGTFSVVAGSFFKVMPVA